MKKLFSTLIVSLFVFNVSAIDILFNRLEKLYEKDKSKCLVVAKRYMDYLPNQASPYYFATVVYKFKAENARNARGEYLHLKKALGYAIKFEEKNNIEI